MQVLTIPYARQAAAVERKGPIMDTESTSVRISHGGLTTGSDRDANYDALWSSEGSSVYHR